MTPVVSGLPVAPGGAELVVDGMNLLPLKSLPELSAVRFYMKFLECVAWSHREEILPGIALRYSICTDKDDWDDGKEGDGVEKEMHGGEFIWMMSP